MAMPTHDTTRSIGEIQKSFLYNFKIIKFPQVGTYPTSDELNARCVSSEVPKKTVENITVNIHGFESTYSGQGKYSKTITVKFQETENNKIKDFIKNWREVCNKFNTGSNEGKAKTEASINLEQLGSNLAVIRTFPMTGCLYADTDLPEMNSESNDGYQVSLTFNYDYFDEK